jgi:hypothetical protein
MLNSCFVRRPRAAEALAEAQALAKAGYRATADGVYSPLTIHHSPLTTTHASPALQPIIQ